MEIAHRDEGDKNLSAFLDGVPEGHDGRQTRRRVDDDGVGEFHDVFLHLDLCHVLSVQSARKVIWSIKMMAGLNSVIHREG